MFGHRGRSLIISVAIAALATGSAAGCGGSGTHTTTSAAASPAPSLPAPLQASPQTPGDTDQDADLASPQPAPTWDAGSRTSAIDAAVRAMRAFARPTVSADTWWQTLAPMLSRGGAFAYQGTDPRTIPAHRVTAPGQLAAPSSAYLAQVHVPTDIGRYEVLLVREGASSPWLVERITPPATAPSAIAPRR